MRSTPLLSTSTSLMRSRLCSAHLCSRPCTDPRRSETSWWTRSEWLFGGTTSRRPGISSRRCGTSCTSILTLLSAPLHELGPGGCPSGSYADRVSFEASEDAPLLISRYYGTATKKGRSQEAAQVSSFE